MSTTLEALIHALPFVGRTHCLQCTTLFVHPRLTQHAIAVTSLRSSAIPQHQIGHEAEASLFLPRLVTDEDDASSGRRRAKLVSDVSFQWGKRTSATQIVSGVLPPTRAGEVNISVRVENSCWGGSVFLNDANAAGRVCHVHRLLAVHLRFCAWLQWRLFDAPSCADDDPPPLSWELHVGDCVGSSGAPSDERMCQFTAGFLAAIHYDSELTTAASSLSACPVVPLRLTRLSGPDPVSFLSWVSLRHPKLLAQFSSVTRLQYDALPASSASANNIRNFNSKGLAVVPHLRSFVARGASFSTITGLFSGCSALHVVDLSRTSVTDVDVVLIGRHASSRITFLSLSMCDRITTIDPLTSCTKLQHLHVEGCLLLKSFGKAIGMLIQRPRPGDDKENYLKEVSFSLVGQWVANELTRLVNAAVTCSPPTVATTAVTRADETPLLVNPLPSITMSVVFDVKALTHLPSSNAATHGRSTTGDSDACKQSVPRSNCNTPLSKFAYNVPSLTLVDVPMVWSSYSRTQCPHMPALGPLCSFILLFHNLRTLSLRRCLLFERSSNNDATPPPSVMHRIARGLALLDTVDLDTCGYAESPHMGDAVGLEWLLEGRSATTGATRRWTRVSMRNMPWPADFERVQSLATQCVHDFVADWTSM